MIHQRYLLLLFCLFPLLAVAQTNADYQKKYQAGKQLVADGKYVQAREALRPVLRVSPANGYAAYAHYFSALASFKNKQPLEAKQMLATLQQKFPTWKQLDEVRYLLANISLDEADYAGAFSSLKAIRSEAMKPVVVGLKKHYFDQVKDLSTLKKLQTTYPDDAVLAEVLVDRLLATQPGKEDKTLADRLQKQFKIERQAKVEEKPMAVVKKDKYNIAVLFPFQLDQLNPSNASRSNQFALDMYEGIKLGKEKLAETGVQINLFAYDIANDANKALDLINSSEFASMDLLIGPLYAETNKVVATYASASQIALINPISYNQKILQDNPHSFLVQTSPELRAAKAAEYAAKNFLPNAALIFYGTAPDDSVMAYAYRDKVKATGGKVMILKKMVNAQFGTSLQWLKSGTVGHIFLATSNQSVATTFMSALAVADSKVPVITNPNLFDFPMIGYDQYEQRNVHFIYPEYVNHSSDSVKTFNNRYITKNNIIPSVYSYQGYDLTVFFGQLLGKFGQHFDADLRRLPPTKAMTLSGFDYTGSNANQYVPLLKFVQSRLVPVNRVE
ncbi:MAG: ABC transporter substrate-binding protein [Bacteroidota bacterium]